MANYQLFKKAKKILGKKVRLREEFVKVN